MTAFERVGEVVLVDDLAAGDIDEHTPRLHCSKPVFVEETMGLGRPLAADHDEIAVRQIAMESSRATNLTEPCRHGLARLRATPGADDAHAECRAEAADIAADAAGADNAGGLTLDQQRAIGAMIEDAFGAVDGGAMQALRKMQNTRHRVLGHGEGAADAARGRDGHVAAPKIAAEQIAGACGALMKPLQARRPGPQIERKRPAAENDFRLREQAITIRAGSRSGGSGCQITRRSIGGPGFAIFPVEPASGVGQSNRPIDSLDLGGIGGGESVDIQDLDFLHGSSDALSENGRTIVLRRGVCYPQADAGYDRGGGRFREGGWSATMRS